MCFWNKKVNFYKNETESKMENPTHALTGHTGNIGFWTLRQDPGTKFQNLIKGFNTARVKQLSNFFDLKIYTF